jgi:leader peptidase (prepilin peptidase)/N-methyltransferase
MYQIVFYLIVALFFASLGSFLTVVYYRIFKEKGKYSIIKPAYSICPSCKHRISIRDNIPVLGYIILGGKCRFCKSPIPIQYFLLEIGMTSVGVLLGYYLS